MEVSNDGTKWCAVFLIYIFVCKCNGNFSNSDIDVSNSPLRDPTKTRNRFEGLLEGAIKLYSNGIKQFSDDGTVNNGSNDVPGAIRLPKDSRGKSAVVTRYI